MLFAACENRIHAIFTFLAMLELIQQKFLAILIGTGRNNFIVEWNSTGEGLDAPQLEEGDVLQPTHDESDDQADQEDVNNPPENTNEDDGVTDLTPGDAPLA